MTSDQKIDIWQQHILEWSEGQLSQKAYCQQNNISFSSFGYWRKRLNRLEKPTKKLLPVTLIQPSAVVVITLPLGVRIDVPMHVLDEVLPVIFRTCQGES